MAGGALSLNPTSAADPRPAHHSQHVGAARQRYRRPGRAHQQQRVLGDQPCGVAPRSRNLRPQLGLLLRRQAGAVGQQKLLPDVQRAPALAGCVVAQRLGLNRCQLPPLVHSMGSGGRGGMLSGQGCLPLAASGGRKGRKRARRRRRRSQQPGAVSPQSPPAGFHAQRSRAQEDRQGRGPRSECRAQRREAE